MDGNVNYMTAVNNVFAEPEMKFQQKPKETLLYPQFCMTHRFETPFIWSISYVYIEELFQIGHLRAVPPKKERLIAPRFSKTNELKIPLLLSQNAKNAPSLPRSPPKRCYEAVQGRSHFSYHSMRVTPTLTHLCFFPSLYFS